MSPEGSKRSNQVQSRRRETLSGPMMDATLAAAYTFALVTQSAKMVFIHIFFRTVCFRELLCPSAC